MNPLNVLNDIFEMIRELKTNYKNYWDKNHENEDYEKIFSQRILEYYNMVEREITLEHIDIRKISRWLRILQELKTLDIYINGSLFHDKY